MTCELSSWARWYAERGCAVFPLLPRTKRPATARGYLEATTDLATVEAWWARSPNANIGIACGDVVVLDVDVKADVRGDRTLVELVRDRGPIPCAPQVCTPTGGQHHYFRPPTGVTVPRRIGWPGVGLDTLGVGGYVVAPPSQTDVGAYQWVIGGPWPDETEWQLPTLWGWLLEATSSPKQPAEAPAIVWRGRYGSDDDLRRRMHVARRYLDRVPRAVAGQRGHDTTFQAARYLVHRFELPDGPALEILSDWNRDCRPPWSLADLARKIEQARGCHTRPSRAEIVRRGAA